MAEQKTSEVYSRLYHYTNLRGLLGILETKRLWATHFKFLNDYSEIVLFRDKLVKFLQSHVLIQYENLVATNQHAKNKIDAAGGLDAVVQADTSAVVDAMYKTIATEIYITSFCGVHRDDPYINDNGLLSQWRGYGDDGGFALVFRTEDLEQLCNKEAENFAYRPGIVADVIYSDDEDKYKLVLSDKLADIAAYVRELFERMRLGNEAPPDITRCAPSFIHCVGRYKHRGFKEENEVRILALPEIHDREYLSIAREVGDTLKPEKERKFREAKGNQVPYIELFDLPNAELPIEKIIVGPHRDKEARAASLRVKLRNTDIDVTVSEIPYVG